MDDLLLFTPSKKIPYSLIRRFIESTAQKQTYDFTNEMSIVEKKNYNI